MAAVNCRGKKLGEELDKLFGAEGRKVGSTESGEFRPLANAN